MELWSYKAEHCSVETKQAFSLSSLRSDVSVLGCAAAWVGGEPPFLINCMGLVILTLGTGAARDSREKKPCLQVPQDVSVHSLVSIYFVVPVEFPADSLH